MCGGAGQPCCAGNVGCTKGFVECRANTCAACGDVGQRCCQGDICQGTHTCDTTGNCVQ
jgi:hypothetical protein